MTGHARTWLGEGLRNVRSGAANTLPIALLLATISSLLGAADALAVTHIARSAATFSADGGTTWIVSSPAAVDGRSCDQLAGSGNILAAGAIRTAPTDLVVANQPSTPIPASQATPGFPAVIRAPEPNKDGGVIMSADALQTLRINDSTTRLADGRYALIAGTFPNPASLQNLDNLAIEIAPIRGLYDQCWVRTDGTDNAQTLALTVIRSDEAASPPQISQLNSANGTTFNAQAQYNSRPTRFAALVAALAGLLVGMLATRRRRLHLAVGRHLGQRLNEQLLQTIGETAPAVVSVLTVCAAAAAILARSAPSGTVRTTFNLAWLPAIASTCTYLIAALAATSTVRESHLYAYFANRT